MNDLEISYYVVGTIAGLVVFFKFLQKLQNHLHYVIQILHGLYIGVNIPIPVNLDEQL